ncbi:MULTISPECIES: phage terminase small subunit [Photorhabdus]|uniref:Phage r protein [enterobacteria phage 186] gb aac34151.1 (U32222) n=2 Tax=Photorhabdus asymbiotica TaxID=291112 RepID=B6VLY0_PHOAA|nr:phage terminase small subunit [Photorhabdus asymbiotica]RKS60211.1 small terminase subunit [Photorhabdus asymbiotica]CAQ86379.1 phage r protein [enterobacteria phage 186] gb/aac34151.1/ (u32222) [Photorhabdus asymbiotica]CAR67160.1 phage r protein [enterobacteria phage 186] gb/aac34151.1/ (u32222) [Photorhabdus asymbiotica subsp. asymbiotica ATCC 43949]
MASPWQRHRMHLQAKEAAQLNGPGLQNNGGYNQMLLMLEQDRRQLKRIQSMERKAELKRQFLPRYAPWVAGVLQGGRGGQDDVLMYILLWRIDAGDYDGALDIAEYALRYRLSMPETHSRTTGCAIAEEIADAAKRCYTAKSQMPLATLERAIYLTHDQDMPDKVLAELYKWLGYSQRDNDLPQPAYCSLSRALELNNHVGVKKDLEQLARALRNQEHANS